MSPEVLYRKWRPQTFDEVVGQAPVTTTLRNAVRMGRVGHAYLFSGPRGTGKTSTGRILAKAVNCLAPVDGEPCNACEACVSITEGRCFDVVEIDAASNRGIDDIRSLREKVGYASGSVARKVYIVDEVHMLTEAASNALLKTLEEPPPHVMFVLATTEFHKVLPTITSRCQCFNFRRLSLDSIIERLALVAQREGVEADQDSLHFIARFASGSLRDAENLTQQLISSVGPVLDAETVRSALGATDDSRVLALTGCIVRRDLAGALHLLQEASDCGADLRQFGRQAVAAFRDLMLVKSGCADVVETGQEERKELEHLAGLTGIADVARYTRLFADATSRDSSQQLLALELACVDSIHVSAAAITAPAAAQDEKPAAPASRVAPSRRPRSRAAAQTPFERSSPSALPAQAAAAMPPAGEPAGTATTVDANVPDGADATHEEAVAAAAEGVAPDGAGTAVSEPVQPLEEGELGQVKARWREYVNSLKGLGSTGNLDAFLRSACEPVAIEGDVLVLKFVAPFHKEKVEDQKYRYIVENQLEKFFGRAYKVSCVLDEQRPSEEKPARPGGHLEEWAIRMGARPRSK